MFIVNNACSVVSSLVPMYSTGNRIEEKENLDEQQMCALALLIAETLLGTLKALNQKNYKAFDANTGDGACQNQALELRRIVSLDLSEELGALKEEALALKASVQARKSNSKARKMCSFERFFSEKVESIAITKEMEYLLHCFLMTVTRVPYKTLESGVILTHTDPSCLLMVSKKLQNVKAIAYEVQVRLSVLNMEAIRREAQAMTTVDHKERVTKMLSEEHTHFYTQDSRYSPKAYGSLFYSVQAVLHRLREEKALIALKSIVKEGGPFYLVMIPSSSGGPFELLLDAAYPDLSPDSPIVIFEAVVLGTREETAREICSSSFTELALTCASHDAPYEPTSELSSIKVPDALVEIEEYRAKTCCFQLDHVYLTTVGKEGVRDATP